MSLSHKDEGGKDETQIIYLVSNVRNHDNEDAFQELRAHLEYYIRVFSRKYKIPGCDADEIEQECLFALRYKAIEDFNPKRGKFKSFAVLCIKRHLFSLIKGNNQLKRRVLNTSLSLDEDRSENGERLSLVSIIRQDIEDIDDQLANKENRDNDRNKLLGELSDLEREVLQLYLQQLHYDEIVKELKKIFPNERIGKKTVDNALQRVRSKAQNMAKNMDFFTD